MHTYIYVLPILGHHIFRRLCIVAEFATVMSSVHRPVEQREERRKTALLQILSSSELFAPRPPGGPPGDLWVSQTSGELPGNLEFGHWAQLFIDIFNLDSCQRCAMENHCLMAGPQLWGRDSQASQKRGGHWMVHLEETQTIWI